MFSTESNLEISDLSESVNNVSQNDTIENLKESLQKNLKAYKTGLKKTNQNIIVNKNTEKEKLKNYFESIKHKSKLNMSNISTTSNKDNDSIKQNVYVNDGIESFNQGNQGESEFLIYETFKNMMNNKKKPGTVSKVSNIGNSTTYTVEPKKLVNNEKINSNTGMNFKKFELENFDNLNLNFKQQKPINDSNKNTIYTTENACKDSPKNHFSPIVSQIPKNDLYYTEIEQNSFISDLKSLNINDGKRTFTKEKVSSFSMTTANKAKIPKNIYKKKFHKLNHSFRNLKLKYLKERKVTEMLSLKLEYETKEAERKTQEVKNLNKLLFSQIQENQDFLVKLEKQLEDKENTINKQRQIIVQQRKIIEELVSKLK